MSIISNYMGKIHCQTYIINDWN